jgi:alanyl-tRNA synthetase
MTRRLYYDDPWTTEFAAVLTGRGEAKGKPYALLEATYFYPESGGQVADTGWLGDARVTDVQDQDGEVRHFLDRPLPAEAGASVAARIDRDVRLDHMQQHTGQHVLSAAFVEVLNAPTVSFHMGDELCTIDLDRDDLTWDDVTRVEERVNAVIREDRPIAVLYPSEAELAAMPLRKDPQVQGNVRVIAVEGFDLSPCGGTHCTRTGQLGAIHVRRWERVRQKARVHFLVGRRAGADHRAKNRVVLSLSAALSAREPELEARVADLLARGKEMSRELEAARAELASHEGMLALANARFIGRHRYATVRAADASHAKALARVLSAEPTVVACVTTPGGEVALASGAEAGVHAGDLFRELAPRRGGRGGGQAGLAQGRVSADAVDAFVEDVAAWLAKLAGDAAAQGRVNREVAAKDGAKVRIREAAPADAEEMIAYTRALLESRPWILLDVQDYNTSLPQAQARLAGYRAKPRAIVLVAEHEGKIVGELSFAAGERARTRHAGDVGISLLAPWRGRGIGRALMETLIAWCRERAIVEKINLGVMHVNEPAIALYRALGFAEEGRIRRAFKIDEQWIDEIRMGLVLS